MRNFNAATSDDKKLKALDQAEKALLNMRKNGVFPTKELAEYASEFFTFSDAVRQPFQEGWIYFCFSVHGYTKINCLVGNSSR